MELGANAGIEWVEHNTVQWVEHNTVEGLESIVGCSREDMWADEVRVLAGVVGIAVDGGDSGMFGVAWLVQIAGDEVGFVAGGDEAVVAVDGGDIAMFGVAWLVQIAGDVVGIVAMGMIATVGRDSCHGGRGGGGWDDGRDVGGLEWDRKIVDDCWVGGNGWGRVAEASRRLYRSHGILEVGDGCGSTVVAVTAGYCALEDERLALLRKRDLHSLARSWGKFNQMQKNTKKS